MNNKIEYSSFIFFLRELYSHPLSSILTVSLQKMINGANGEDLILLIVVSGT
jgi:hypothetical protein